MKKIIFEKEEDGRWYIFLPLWQGDHADLEMVAGADAMLEMLSDGEKCVTLEVSSTEFLNADKLTLVREALELENGAIYNVESLNGKQINMEIWLCDVTKFVLGYFPAVIYLKKIE